MSFAMDLRNIFSPQKRVLIYRTLFINWSWGWRRQKYGYMSEHDKEVHITCILWKESRIWLIYACHKKIGFQRICFIWFVNKNIVQNNSEFNTYITSLMICTYALFTYICTYFNKNNIVCLMTLYVKEKRGKNSNSINSNFLWNLSS